MVEECGGGGGVGAAARRGAAGGGAAPPSDNPQGRGALVLRNRFLTQQKRDEMLD